MNKIMGLLISMVVASTSSAALFQSESKYSENKTNESIILDAYAAALGTTQSNQIQTEVKKLQSEIDDLGTVLTPETTNILVLESGKGGVAEYGTENLLCIPVSMQGSGAILNCGTYFKVYVSHNLATETTIVTFDSVVELKSKK